MIAGCGILTNKKPATIRDVAYDRNKLEYTIYISEEGAFVPYLVVTSNYGDHALLLREHLLEETMPYKENERHMWARYENGAYYANSSIDSFLNNIFPDRFTQALRDSIVDSQIIITDVSSLGITGEKAIVITRKIFLLSLKELYSTDLSTAVKEGETLAYFDDDYRRRVAAFANGQVSPYWTRTPETWETYTVFTMGIGIEISGADENSGVRPAFCLDKSTPIQQSDDIVEGQTVYILAADQQ
jgi:hypothetical protein